MPDETPPLFALDKRGRLWPIAGFAGGQPVGVVVNPEDFAAGEAPAPESPNGVSPLDVVLGFLNACNPAELEAAAMARLGMGDAENAGPTRHILAVLKERAVEAFAP